MQLAHSACGQTASPPQRCVFEIGNSRAVTCRVHPPLSILFRASANGYLNGGTVPESVSVAHTALGFCASSGFCGP